MGREGRKALASLQSLLGLAGYMLKVESKTLSSPRPPSNSLISDLGETDIRSGFAGASFHNWGRASEAGCRGRVCPGFPGRTIDSVFDSIVLAPNSRLRARGWGGLR